MARHRHGGSPQIASIGKLASYLLGDKEVRTSTRQFYVEAAMVERASDGRNTRKRQAERSAEARERMLAEAAKIVAKRGL